MPLVCPTAGRPATECAARTWPLAARDSLNRSSVTSLNSRIQRVPLICRKLVSFMLSCCLVLSRNAVNSSSYLSALNQDAFMTTVTPANGILLRSVSLLDFIVSFLNNALIVKQKFVSAETTMHDHLVFRI